MFSFIPVSRGFQLFEMKKDAKWTYETNYSRMDQIKFVEDSL